MKTIGLALGGGGARGIAHIAYLKAMEQQSIKPHVIAGTSSGAIVGALYAGGMSPDGMYAMLESAFCLKRSGAFVLKLLKHNDLAGALTEKFLSKLLLKKTFEELEIPLKLVATNFHTLQEKVFTQGEILPALMSSIAFPNVFVPQRVGSELYVDGGATNIVPFDIIRKECDVLIAIDVSQVRADVSLKPSNKNALHATWAATEEALIQAKLKESPVDIFERPTLEDISTMEFYKFKSIYKRAEALLPGFVEQLKKVR